MIYDILSEEPANVLKKNFNLGKDKSSPVKAVPTVKSSQHTELGSEFSDSCFDRSLNLGTSKVEAFCLHFKQAGSIHTPTWRGGTSRQQPTSYCAIQKAKPTRTVNDAWLAWRGPTEV